MLFVLMQYGSSYKVNRIGEIFLFKFILHFISS